MQATFRWIGTLKAAIVAKAAEYRSNIAAEYRSNSALTEQQLANARLDKFRALAAYACA
ncbi:hypothetical protein [Trinickia sp.]|uniref:hypothetical protein n=1 Tax=Trinickia sp. TaxID=2571163 RepID=UPI003F7F0004